MSCPMIVGDIVGIDETEGRGYDRYCVPGKQVRILYEPVAVKRMSRLSA